MLGLLLCVFSVECVVTGIAYFDDKKSVVLSDSHKVVVPVITLLVLDQGSLINGNGIIIFRKEEQDVWSVCPVGGVSSREHLCGDSGPHEAFYLFRYASIHDVDSLVEKGVL